MGQRTRQARRHRTKGRAAGAAAVGAALAAASLVAAASSAQARSGGAAAAQSPKLPSGASAPTDPQVIAVMTAQKPLDDARDRITALAENADSATSGLGHVAIDTAKHAITVSWHGQLPAGVQREIAADRRRGIAVTVTTSAYTATQFYAEMHRLTQALPADSGVDSISVSDDESGLVIGVAPQTAAEIAPHRTPAVADVPGLRGASSMPLTVKVVAPMKPSYASRQTGYWFTGAGEGLHAPNNDPEKTYSSCTTGFAVQAYGGGRRYIMTAAHCGWMNWSDYTGLDGPQGTYIGRTAAMSYSSDTQLIPARVVAYEWDGTSMIDAKGAAWNSPPGGQFTKYIAGEHANGQGDSLCVSGSFSGAQCFVQIQSAYKEQHQVLDHDGVKRWADVWRSENLHGRDISGEGDSGGPVFTRDALFGWGAVDAAGMISGMDSSQVNTNCLGVPSDSTLYGYQFVRHCSPSLYFSDIAESTNDLGVDLLKAFP